MKLKYYKVKRRVEGLLEIGDKFVSWNEQRLYPEKANSFSGSLSMNILNSRGGIDKYFEECEPFHFLLFDYLVEKALDDIRHCKTMIKEYNTRLKENEEVVFLYNSLRSENKRLS